jgi:fructokinase
MTNHIQIVGDGFAEDLEELVTIGNTAGAAAVATIGPFDADDSGLAVHLF